MPSVPLGTSNLSSGSSCAAALEPENNERIRLKMYRLGTATGGMDPCAIAVVLGCANGSDEVDATADSNPVGRSRPFARGVCAEIFVLFDDIHEVE